MNTEQQKIEYKSLQKIRTGEKGFKELSMDGHDIQAIVDAIQAPVTPGKPRFICCETVKGKGVSFMENVVGWHGKAPNKEEYIKAMKELGVEVDG